MKGLIQKDICILTGKSKSLLVLVIVGLIMFISSDGSFATSYLTMLGCIMGISTISYDEFDNGYPFLFSLPITRSDYVRSKYIFCISMGILGLLEGLILSCGGSLLMDKVMQESLLETAISSLALTFLILAFMLPVQLKYGAEKSRYVMVIIAALCASIGYFAKDLLSKFIEIDISKLNTFTDRQFLIGFILIGLILIIVSYFISVKIVNDKEY